MIIFCWTHPRSRSSILEKSFSQVVHTLHEPFSGVYYANSSPPSKADFSSGHHALDFDSAVGKILKAEEQFGTVFVKELAYCVWRQIRIQRFDDILKRSKHFCLYRDPASSVLSLYKQMKYVYGNECTIDRIDQACGYTDLLLWVCHLETLNCILLYVNSDDLISDPSKYLSDLCIFLGLTFSPKMLKWDKGPLHDWAIWDTFGWHDNAKLSTHFEQPDRNAIEEINDPQLQNLIQKQSECFETLSRKRSDSMLIAAPLVVS